MSIKNQKYWENRAQEYLGQIDIMTSNDIMLANLETKALSFYFANQPQYRDILEIGCGSGRIVKTLAAQYPTNTWHGIDYSETMINQAMSLNIPNASFEVADMLEWHASSQYNHIFMVRSLTNLASRTEQTMALDRIQSFIKPSGALILLEPTVQGLEQLNIIREQFSLEPMQASWFNCYLDLDKVTKQLQNNFSKVEIQQFSATYCFLSRVLNAILAKQEDRKPSYTDYLNQIGISLDQTISNISTHIMIVATR